MPSFTIHEAVALEVNKKLKLPEEELLLGSIAPDCWRNAKIFGKEDRTLSHFSTKESYDEKYWLFYKKYKEKLSNPFVMGYLIHLMTDYYWRIIVTNRLKFNLDNKVVYRNKDGTIYDTSNDKNSFKYENKNIHGLDRDLFAYYKIKKMRHIEELNITNPIEEIDMTGLNDTIDYANRMIDNNGYYETPLFSFEDILVYLQEISSIISEEIINEKVLERDELNDYRKK